MAGRGGANSAYFFRLERYQSKINSIYRPNLNINGVVTNDAKLISDFCSKFYSNSFSSKHNESQLLSSVNNVRQMMWQTKIIATPLFNGRDHWFNCSTQKQ